MSIVRSVSLGLLASVAFVDAASPCPNGVLSILAVNLGKYPPAQTYCTSKFPVPAVTATSTAPKTTQTVTAATRTVTTASGTVTSTLNAPLASTTVTLPPVTVTSTVATSTASTSVISTSTVFTTTTTTVTVAAAAKKRAATPLLEARVPAPATTTQDARASAFSSLIQQASKVIGTVCTCLETAKSTTVTVSPAAATSSVTATTTVGAPVTVTTTVTSTTTLTSAPTSTSSVTATVTNTNTLTEVVTSTVEATATVTAQPANPNQCPVAGAADTVDRCGGQCYCYKRATAPQINVCIDATDCATCNTDSDCVAASGGVCATNNRLTACGDANVCVYSFCPAAQRLLMRGASYSGTHTWKVVKPSTPSSPAHIESS